MTSCLGRKSESVEVKDVSACTHCGERVLYKCLS